VELCHDTHERLAPSMTVQLAKALEPYRLFFLEDSLPPEQVCLCSNHMYFVQMI
jgi:mannonate dehydratase